MSVCKIDGYVFLMYFECIMFKRVSCVCVDIEQKDVDINSL